MQFGKIAFELDPYSIFLRKINLSKHHNQLKIIKNRKNGAYNSSNSAAKSQNFLMEKNNKLASSYLKEELFNIRKENYKLAKRLNNIEQRQANKSECDFIKKYMENKHKIAWKIREMKLKQVQSENAKIGVKLSNVCGYVDSNNKIEDQKKHIYFYKMLRRIKPIKCGKLVKNKSAENLGLRRDKSESTSNNRYFNKLKRINFFSDSTNETCINNITDRLSKILSLKTIKNTNKFNNTSLIKNNSLVNNNTYYLLKN